MWMGGGDDAEHPPTSKSSIHSFLRLVGIGGDAEYPSTPKTSTWAWVKGGGGGLASSSSRNDVMKRLCLLVALPAQF